jgi:predicted flap endonuclease-1-like 5' DNA nuclease
MENKDTDSPFGKLGNPAQRALANAGITTLQQLSKFTEKEILKLHGMGKASLPILRAALVQGGLAFAG